ncbi:YbaB/EbfC family nucleoid-associated protein [Allokutzneria sp. A3M-2-11 16]|uniref:YbaB/EbfC family nucleoid-associated protein n=1 Tax=Allokutzneria sp. A3M-2-11 16 TaxID=2962043 RepID=UPI0020B65F5B|nr:YbaB/EbfC family nucleoid-associated protein [Allokutzneria sp. A3M-2-11 16]MCP3800398.1 YbaB/EbfC family nucleoid-associated protein [Allokutzneria sp. A3M-2-11 16]
MSTPELIASAEQQRAQAAELERALATVTGTATSADGLVEATVTARGRLVGLRLHPNSVRLGPTLGEEIVRAAQAAAEQANQRAYNVMAPVLGDELTAAIEAVAGPAPERERAAEVVPVSTAFPDAATHSAEADDEDDVFTFDASTLRSDR